MIAVGFFVMKKLVFDLVDEVWDDGGSLLIKNRGEEERVALSDIKNVSYSPLINPPRVTLSLRRPTVFGDEITFNAPMRFMPFSASPIIKELIDRIDLARRKKLGPRLSWALAVFECRPKLEAVFISDRVDDLIVLGSSK
jgi:hypothetical protein